VSYFRCPHCDGIIGVVGKGGTPVKAAKDVHECKQCGIPFERGSNGTGEHRRTIAIFCSEKCKNRFHYLKRRDEALR
jgi:hypothetical protein